jgi:hypothetical protein
MEKLLLAAVLACQSGNLLVDWSNRIPLGINFADVIVTVEPFYTRLSIYPVGHPENVQRCCRGKQISVMRLPLGDGRFCIGQSQLQMKWTVRLTLMPGLEM